MAELRLLGPVELRVAGRALDLGPAKQRAVLAAMLVDDGQPTSTETLIDRVWGDNPPASVRSALYSYIARLRHVLRSAADGAGPDATPALIEHAPGGYRLSVAGYDVDLHRFRRLIAAARERPDGADRTGADRIRADRTKADGTGRADRTDGTDGTRDEHRAALLAEARDLWCGPALADLPGEWAARTRDALAQQRLDVTVAWARIQLRLGRAGELVGPLREALGEHPLVEPLAAALIEALLREGRTAEALDCYHLIRRRLVDELGVEPGPALRRLHATILNSDKNDDDDAGTASPLAVPAQLPLDVHGFTGRDAEIAALDSLLAAAATEPTAVGVFTLCGGAGVGKTALAVHWAHRVAAWFPGGRLFVNLRGFDPANGMTTAEAVRLFLDALGVPAARVPASEDAQIGLYRSLLAGRRVLVVLDNAATAEQVRPLLPGSPGCLALVTSRDRLTGLGTAEAAHPVTLDVLGAAEARALLAVRIGAARVSAEPDAVSELVERCARLPLALAVVAARAAAQPDLPLGRLAAELAEDRLDAFSDTDPAADLRTVFSLSYTTVSGPAARLFRLLGLHPGPDVDVHAAASLAGIPPARARRLLAELARAHLVAEHGIGRFGFHDLLRAYAAELAHAHDSARSRRAAVHRGLDHYVHGAYAMACLVTPHREPIELPPPRPGVTPPAGLDEHARALAWVTERRTVLLANLRLAARTGFEAHAWRLAWALGPALDRSGHWRELAETHELALAAAGRVADRRGQEYAHRILGRALTRIGDLDAARVHFDAALGLCAETGDPVGQAHTHLSLGWLHEQRRAYREALGHVRQAETLYAAAGHAAGLGGALNQAGWYHAQLGEYDEALAACERALALQVEAGHRHGQAGTWDSLGFANHHLGRYAEAARCYRSALQLHQHDGDRYREATTHIRLGDCHSAAGDAVAAHCAWTAAATILERLHHPDATAVNAKLAAASGQPAQR